MVERGVIVSHEAIRRQERCMKRFKSPKQAQRFLSVHGPINNLFRLRRHLLNADDYRKGLHEAFEAWRAIALLGECT